VLIVVVLLASRLMPTLLADTAIHCKIGSAAVFWVGDQCSGRGEDEDNDKEGVEERRGGGSAEREVVNFWS
jgi:hypothetical protein